MNQRRAAICLWTINCMVTVVACGPPPEDALAPGQQQAAIVNGAVSHDYLAVGALVADDSFGCSATLIADNALLTAAHCVYDRSSVAFMPGALDGPRYYASGVHVHPDYAGGNQADLAVIELERAVEGIEPLAVARQAPTVGEAIVLVGLGQSTDGAEPAFGTRRSGTTRIGAVSQQIFSFFGADGVVNICDGDSGGPAIASRDGVDRLVGVHSTRDDRCGDAGHDIRVDVHRQWIRQQIGELPSDAPARPLPAATPPSTSAEQRPASATTPELAPDPLAPGCRLGASPSLVGSSWVVMIGLLLAVRRFSRRTVGGKSSPPSGR